MIALSWMSLLLILVLIFGSKFYIRHHDQALIERDNHIKAMGQACIHHVHNMSASANADLKDIYSVGVNNPDIYKWQATMDCLEKYPFYSDQESYTPFNTALN